MQTALIASLVIVALSGLLGIAGELLLGRWRTRRIDRLYAQGHLTEGSFARLQVSVRDARLALWSALVVAALLGSVALFAVMYAITVFGG